MKVGVNGAVRDISDLKVGVNGAVRAVSEAHIGVSGAVKKVWPLIEVGYQEILDTVGSGEWTCPASGQWEVEGHGGGGHGSKRLGTSVGGAGGGGSGELETIILAAGQAITYKVGAGDDYFSQGGTTSFGELEFPGGFSSNYGSTAGRASGSIASSGRTTHTRTGGAGGKGNVNNSTQSYGNGGRGANASSTATVGEPGKDGAIILTYLG